MRVLGVELKGSEANICLLSLTEGLFDIPDCRVRKFTIQDHESNQCMKDFQFAFAKLVADYSIEKVVIRQRQLKGKFAGSAVGFKMEAALQLSDDIDVALMSPIQIKESIKQNPIPLPFSDTGLKVFQEPAFATAFAYLSIQN